MVSDEQFQQNLLAIEQEERARTYRQEVRREQTEEFVGAKKQALEFNNRAADELDRNEYREAHRLMLRAWELTPDDERVRRNVINITAMLGWSLIGLKRYQEVLDLTVPLQENGFSGASDFSANTSVAYLGLGMFGEAIKDAEEALISHHSSENYIQLGNCYARKVESTSQETEANAEDLLKAVKAFGNAYRFTFELHSYKRWELDRGIPEKLANEAAKGGVSVLHVARGKVDQAPIMRELIWLSGLTPGQQEDYADRVQSILFERAWTPEVQRISDLLKEQRSSSEDENAT